nr:hypothetical protein [Pandoravirus aubagnensis]
MFKKKGGLRSETTNPLPFFFLVSSFIFFVMKKQRDFWSVAITLTVHNPQRVPPLLFFFRRTRVTKQKKQLKQKTKAPTLCGQPGERHKKHSTPSKEPQWHTASKGKSHTHTGKKRLLCFSLKTEKHCWKALAIDFPFFSKNKEKKKEVAAFFSSSKKKRQ